MLYLAESTATDTYTVAACNSARDFGRLRKGLRMGVLNVSCSKSFGFTVKVFLKTSSGSIVPCTISSLVQVSGSRSEEKFTFEAQIGLISGPWTDHEEFEFRARDSLIDVCIIIHHN